LPVAVSLLSEITRFSASGLIIYYTLFNQGKSGQRQGVFTKKI
jgi:hypothetical protein